MNFREYRRKETIRAAEITEETILAVPVKIADSESKPSPESFEPFPKGQYVENRNGLFVGYTKEEFELRFTSIRAPRQSKQDKKSKRKAAASGERSNDRVTPLPELATK